MPERTGELCRRNAARHSQNHHETAEGYLGVIARLDDRHRVIVCKDQVQWIIQVRRGERRGQPRWTGVRYAQTREALIAAGHALCSPLPGDCLAKLSALPSRIGGAP